MIKLILPGSIRSKKNSKRIIKAGKFTKIIPSKAYLKWEMEARQATMIQVRSWKPLITPVSVKVTSYYKGSRPDLSGVLESVGDCLEGLIWGNDRQIESWDGSRVYHDPKTPRTEVEIHYEQ